MTTSNGNPTTDGIQPQQVTPKKTAAERIGEVVLEVNDLRTYFVTRWGVTKAVDGVSFNLRRGETLGIVGESGSGKSVTSLSIMRLIPSPPGHIVGGQVLLQGEDILQIDEHEMEKVRGNKIAMVLQDPMTALNPVFDIEDQVGESLRIHKKLSGPSLKGQVVEMLRKVRIPAPEIRMRDYPHQLSGGMRQRVVGAIGISADPVVLIADEPTTSLDATIQAQYLRLLRDLQEEIGVAIIFITHDFGIVAKMCDRVAVMYAGKIVEQGDVRQIFNNPSHPYTEALIYSVPKLEEKTDRLYSIPGQPPALWNLPPGCAFAPRCPYVHERCQEQYPDMFPVDKGQYAACWLREKEAVKR
ncbi:MAG: ABC transporter ATP-binding protein [Chloroflexi bacterium]|nr:ABC transporter ATP-binding protein [Chloroflexota bacterium]